MTDRILIDDLRLFGYHGVLPEEAVLGQRFRIDLRCGLDLMEAGRSDDVAHTVHYGQLIALVETIVTTHRYQLIERLAEVIAQEALTAFPRIETILVRITKPEAPVPSATGIVAVEIERSRSLG
jgi:dihydroneopterin aldolase